MKEVVPQELDIEAFLNEHLKILIGGLGACVLIPSRDIVVYNQYTFFALRPVPCLEGVRRTVIDRLLFKLLSPFFLEFIIVDELISLKSAALHISAVGYAFKMHHHRLRLEHHPFSVLPYLKGKVTVLAVSRGISLIKAAYLLPELAPYHDGSTGDIVDLLHIVVLRLLRVIEPSIIPARGIRPDYAPGLLKPAVRIDELGAGHADAVVRLHQGDKAREPALGHLGIIVKEEDVSSPRKLSRLIAVFKEAEIFCIAAQYQSAYVAFYLRSGISGDVIGQYDLIGRALKVRMLYDRSDAGIGIGDLVICRKDYGNQYVLISGLRKLEEASLLKLSAYGKVTLYKQPSFL